MSANIRLAPHALALAVALPLVAGGIIGFAVRGALDEPVVASSETSAIEGPRSVAVTNTDVEALRARIRDLEKLLNDREESLAKLSERPQEDRPAPPDGETEAASEKREQPRRRESFRERMERMKQEEPERYAEMQKRHEEFQARMRAANEARDNYLSSVDTSRMTAEQKAAHERLLAALKTRDDYMERMRPDAENPLTDEERQAAHEAMREIGPLMEQERQYLLEETGRAYGEDGSEFAEYIQDIYENTSFGPPMRRGRGQGRGGPGGPGGASGGGGAAQ